AQPRAQGAEGERSFKEDRSRRLAGLPLVLMALQDISLAVPALDREAEAGAADLAVGPPAGALGGEEADDAGAAGQELPPPVPLLGDQPVALAGVAVAVGPALDQHRRGRAVAIHLPNRLDRALGIGRLGVFPQA